MNFPDSMHLIPEIVCSFNIPFQSCMSLLHQYIKRRLYYGFSGEKPVLDTELRYQQEGYHTGDPVLFGAGSYRASLHTFGAWTYFSYSTTLLIWPPGWRWLSHYNMGRMSHRCKYCLDFTPLHSNVDLIAGADRRYLSEVEGSLGETSCCTFEKGIRQATQATPP